jgi:perosamine synthetase
MIPVNEPRIGARELEYVTECLRTGWISSEGRFIKEFEASWAEYCGMKHGISVANGTVALEVAVGCLGLSPGDEVILPTFTIVSCAQAVVYAGATPVLVDSDPRTWCMDVGQVAAAITPRTRAIMPVHMYGHPVDMDPLRELARKHDLIIVEDAAEAHGAEYRGRRCGSLGDLSCFSFYANKIITTGEGGMVLTNRDDLAERLRSLRNLCFKPERRFFHTELGHNFRFTNLQAAIGLAQVEGIAAALEHKRWMAAAYGARLGKLATLQLPVEEPWAKNVYWMYGVVVDEKSGMDAPAFARKLADRGVMTRPFFLGMHEQPALHQLGFCRDLRFPVAERLARQGLYLPSGSTLTQSQVDQTCDAVEAVLGNSRV